MIWNQQKRFLSTKDTTGACFLATWSSKKRSNPFCVRDNPNQQVPFIHNLAKLAERTKLVLTQEQRTLLLEINQFNIKGRYPDYKFEFYRKCTHGFTENYFSKIKELYNWLLQQM